MKLRKWCVKKSVEVSRNANEAAYFTEYIYNFLKSDSI